MKKILVSYWNVKFKDLPYKHQEEFEFSIRKRNGIITKILSKGYSVMLRPVNELLIIYIDKGRFGQS
jgi:hypothetical protein